MQDIARWVLKAIPKTAILPILSGPNRGFLWVVGASANYGCWIGWYERPFMDRVVSTVRPAMTVFDVGAHTGYYTLALSRLVGAAGRVFAFEASSANVIRLRRHLQLNHVKNVEIIEAAVTDHVGTAYFQDDDFRGALSSFGRPVKTVRLDDYPTPHFVKMDIERAETLALRGSTRILSENITTWFIATHGDCANTDCSEMLRNASNSIEQLTVGELWAQPSCASEVARAPQEPPPRPS
jgi:FkbM family methyltransferase